MFEAFFILKVLEACQWVVLSKTSQDVCYFMPQGGYDKLIVKIVDSDRGMCETVVHIIGMSEAELESEHGAASITWNLCPTAQGEHHSLQNRGETTETDDHQL